MGTSPHQVSWSSFWCWRSPGVPQSAGAAIRQVPTLAWAVRGSLPTRPAGPQASQPVHLPCPCGGGAGSSGYELSPHEPLHGGLSGVTLAPVFQSRPRRMAGHQLGPPDWEAGANAILMETSDPEGHPRGLFLCWAQVGGESLSFPLNPATCLRPRACRGSWERLAWGEAGQVLPRCLRRPILTPATSFRSPGLGSPPHSEEGLGSG